MGIVPRKLLPVRALRVRGGAMVRRRAAGGRRSWLERSGRAQVVRELAEEADLGGDRADQVDAGQVPASARVARAWIARRQAVLRADRVAHSLVTRPPLHVTCWSCPVGASGSFHPHTSVLRMSQFLVYTHPLPPVDS